MFFQFFWIRSLTLFFCYCFNRHAKWAIGSDFYDFSPRHLMLFSQSYPSFLVVRPLCVKSSSESFTRLFLSSCVCWMMSWNFFLHSALHLTLHPQLWLITPRQSSHPLTWSARERLTEPQLCRTSPMSLFYMLYPLSPPPADIHDNETHRTSPATPCLTMFPTCLRPRLWPRPTRSYSISP